MRRLLAVALTTIAAGGAGMAAQDRPNFSGRWVLDKPVADAGVAVEFVVRQDAQTFTVGHDDNRHAISYRLHGSDHPITSHVGSVHDVKSIGKATWEGDKLVVERTDNYQSGLTRTLKQVWSLDASGLLTVESSNVTSAGESTNTRNVYARKSMLP